MSPLSLRRYRAERLLRQQFQALHTGVIAAVGRRLRARGVRLDEVDLEACYAQAWHALYAAVLSGREIANPPGWLALVTYRRAIDEHRARRRLESGLTGGADAPLGERQPHERDGLHGAGPCESDLAAELDDRVRLRQLFEGLRLGLGGRELEAATLCYLHGLSRAEAAARMGVSEARMRKLMEGQGPGRPGVAGKVGALVATIRDGDWCEEQASLMRGLAMGVLDPDGERYRLAQAHRDECPACRAYVRSLRGLAAILPPLPALLDWVLDSARGGAVAGGAAAHGAASMHGGLGAGAGSTAGGAPSVSTAAGAGGAGAGAASGGWLLAGGGAATKLAVGCLLAAGLSAGCVALTLGPAGRAQPADRRHPAEHAPASAAAGAREPARAFASAQARARQAPARSAPARGSQPLSPATQASHEFGPEQAPPGGAGGAPVDRASATIPAHAVVAASPGSGGRASAGAGEPSGERATTGARSGSGSAGAQREFGIG